MAKTTKLYTYTKIDDRTPIQKLSLKDQLRVMLRQATKSERNELATEDAVTREYLIMRANLLDFINRSTKTIREGKHSSVTMSISNKFAPVLDEVLNSPSVTNFYTVEISSPNVEYDILYFYKVRLEVKTH